MKPDSYENICKIITKYPEIINTAVPVWGGRFSKPYSNSREIHCMFSLMGYNEINNTCYPATSETTCREVFALFAHGNYAPYYFGDEGNILGAEFKKRILSKNFRLLSVRFNHDCSASVKLALRALNIVERKCKIDRTVMLSKNSSEFLFIMSDKWFSSNVLISAVLQVIKNKRSNLIPKPTTKLLTVLMGNRKELFESSVYTKISHLGVRNFLNGSVVYLGEFGEQVLKDRSRYIELGGPTWDVP